MFYMFVIQFNVDKKKEREEKREREKKKKKKNRLLFFFFFFFFFHLILDITKKPGEYMNELAPSVPRHRLDDSS